MKYVVVTTNSFKKDLKRLKKQNKDIIKLKVVISTLEKGDNLQAKHRPHLLSGNWKGHWECHIEPDWLLIWFYYKDELTLVRSGSHSDLF